MILSRTSYKNVCKLGLDTKNTKSQVSNTEAKNLPQNLVKFKRKAISLVQNTVHSTNLAKLYNQVSSLQYFE